MFFHSALAAMLLAVPMGQASLASDIAAILARPNFQNATVGVEIRSLETMETIYSHNGASSLIPASNQKLSTAAVALTTLGGGFRYTTTLLTTAKPDTAGTLHGDVYLRGSGDPSMSSGRLAILGKALVAAGVKKITGRVIGDGTRFDNLVLGLGWEWDDEPYYYSAQIAAMNCDENVVNVTVTPGRAPGAAPAITIDGAAVDQQQYVQVQSTVQTVGTAGASNVNFDRARGQNVLLLSGTIPVGGAPAQSPLTIENPPSFAAYRMALALRNEGIAVSTAPTAAGTTPSGAIAIANSTSLPFSELMKLWLKPSDNLYGETIFKTVGYMHSPSQPGSATTAIAALQAFLQTAGIGTQGVVPVDGSGLSRQDSLTVHYLCDLLAYVYGRFAPADRDIFINALPIGGVDGDLTGMFQHPPLKGKVHAKTGTETGISALSGYLLPGSGQNYIFSIVMNQAFNETENLQAQQDIVTALYNHTH